MATPNPQIRAQRNAPTSAILDVLRPGMLGTTWDIPNQVLTLCWDGRRAWIGSITAAPGLHPDKIPILIARVARDTASRQLAAHHDGGTPPTLYAVAFLAEYWVISHDPRTASEWDRARFQRDSRERRYHERPDRREGRQCFAADIDGRTYSLETLRGDAAIHEAVLDTPNQWFTDPTAPDTETRLSGAVVKAVQHAGRLVGAMLYGDPPPRPGQH